MAKTKQQKVEIVNTLTDAFKTSPSTVFVHFKGFTVGKETNMRGALKEENVTYTVARKTLLRRAIADAGIEGEVPPLEGEVAVAYGSDDPTAPARIINGFVKENKENLSIIGGIYEGKLMDAAGMNEIATIPPIETLRGMFANVINSPIQQLVIALNAIAEKKEA